MEPGPTDPRRLYEDLVASGAAVRYPFGRRPVVVNVDLQRAYTAIDSYATAYTTDAVIAQVNRVVGAARASDAPTVWTYVAYEPSGADSGIWGTRTSGPDALRSITDGSDRAALDDRLNVNRERDLILRKRMPSAFFETHLASWLRAHGADTVVVTGGSSSGCLRATAVDAISHGYPTFVAEDAISDRHPVPHHAALYDLAVKYADVRPAADLVALLTGR